MARKIRILPFISLILLNCVLLAPLLGFLFTGESPKWLAFSVWWPVLIFTTLQATVSALFSLAVGFVIGVGLWGATERLYTRCAWWLVWVFSGMPALVWIFGIFSINDLLKTTLPSFASLVVAHICLNAPIVALATPQILASRWAPFSDVIRTLGLKGFFLWRKALIPLVLRPMSLVGLTIFVFCFSSFSVPLVFSSDGHITLEVLIYQKTLQSGQLSHGLFLAGFQFLFLFFISMVISTLKLPAIKQYQVKHGFIVSQVWGVASKVGLGLMVLILLSSLRFPNLTELGQLDSVLLQSGLRSLSVVVLTMLFIGILSILILLGRPRGILQMWFRGFTAPSMSLIGIGVYLLRGEAEGMQLLKLSLAMALLFFPVSYKWLLEAALDDLETQRDQVRVLGLSDWLAFRKIFYPQLKSVIYRLMGLAGIWAAVDFALARIILDGPPTLGLLAIELMGRYQLESGFSVLVLAVLVGFFSGRLFLTVPEGLAVLVRCFKGKA